jgi:predicted MFS family arabinose efflux permease
VAILLLVYGVGATVGNLAGGWLTDRALMPSQLGLLALLVVTIVAPSPPCDAPTWTPQTHDELPVPTT